MIRDYGQIYSGLTNVRNRVAPGLPDENNELFALSNQLIDLLDTLHQRPDELMARRHDSRIHTLEQDNHYLKDQVNILLNNHNKTQDTMRKMGTELDKFHKIFAFLVEQKEGKTNE